MESKHSNLENQNEQKPIINRVTRLGTILNSPLVILLIGSLIGILGLFTWQRKDWVEKTKLAREEVIFDRQVNIIDKINADVGYYLADANTAIQAINKAGAVQQAIHIGDYNQRQSEWFGISLSYEAILQFYFSEDKNTFGNESILNENKTISNENESILNKNKSIISKKFEEIIKATKDVDIELQSYHADSDETKEDYNADREKKSYESAINAVLSTKEKLNDFNRLCRISMIKETPKSLIYSKPK